MAIKINYKYLFLILPVIFILAGLFYYSKTRAPLIRYEKIYYVSPQGNDENDGRTKSSPLRTIQKAVDVAGPGDAVELLDGEYLQDVVSKNDGRPDAPVTIKGSRKAVLKGGGNPRVIEINHDHIRLTGFTVDGHFEEEESPKSYRDKLIYAQGKGERDGVTDLKISEMEIKNAGGECVRLRYFATDNEITRNKISACGAYDFKFNKGGKNGEGIYIGTAPEQRGDGKNPTEDPDHSNDNWVHDNDIDTQGNECVDIKEGARNNMIENNRCTGQKDPESAGLDSRGSGNIFRGNEVWGSAGAGIRLGGDEEEDGRSNEVYLNTLRENKNGGIKFEAFPQELVCGNKFIRNGSKNFVGEYSSEAQEAGYDKSCPLSVKLSTG